MKKGIYTKKAKNIFIKTIFILIIVIIGYGVVK